MQAVSRHDAAMTRHTIGREQHAVSPVVANPGYQAYLILRSAFTVAPILFGVDKFLSVMVDWTKYLAPVFPKTLGVSPELFMRGVGAIEIAAGILVAIVPRFAAYVVAAWLGLIIVNLLLLGQYFDVALRDFGLLLGALALARLAQGVHRSKAR